MTSASPYVPDNPRILIVRLSAIGDTVHSLPLAAALRRNYPGSHIGWVVERPSASLIERNPLMNWVKVLPKGWLKSLSQVAALRRELRAERFDIAFDIQGLTKSAVAARLSGAPVRIGFTRGEGRELAPLLDNVLVPPRGRHAVDMTLSLLAGLKLPPPLKPEFMFPRPSEDDLTAIDVSLRDGVYAPGYILMGPWGSFASKLWPLERFLELAVRFYRETGLPSVMLGHGDGERGQAAALAAKAEEALKLAPDVSLPGVAELARRARLFVGCDSFPMHAAAAVGAPTLGLFGITDPQRLGPYGANGKVVFHDITLVKSTRERRHLSPDNMLALTVETVLRAALEMVRG